MSWVLNEMVEHQKHMFKLMGKKIFSILYPKTAFSLTYIHYWHCNNGLTIFVYGGNSKKYLNVFVVCRLSFFF